MEDLMTACGLLLLVAGVTVLAAQAGPWFGVAACCLALGTALMWTARNFARHAASKGGNP